MVTVITLKSLVLILIAWHRSCVQKRQKMEERSYVEKLVGTFKTQMLIFESQLDIANVRATSKRRESGI